MVLKDNSHLFFVEFTLSALNERGLDGDLIGHLKRRAEKKSGITLEEIMQKALDAQKKIRTEEEAYRHF